MKKILAIIAVFLPWKIKRFIYIKVFNFRIDSSAKIGYSFVFCTHLRMDAFSQIGHLSVIKGMEEVRLGEYSYLGNLNWISGFPVGSDSLHFADQSARSPRLLLGDHAQVTHRHLIDCTDCVSIGKFATLAGFRSQILTHSISIMDSRQQSGPVEIGDYTFVGTASVILPGSRLPSYSILGAGSVLNKNYADEYQLYAGNPARPIKRLEHDAAYFNRSSGYIL